MGNKFQVKIIFLILQKMMKIKIRNKNNRKNLKKINKNNQCLIKVKC